MDESFQDLETELKSLRPRAPSPRLQERVEREFQATTAVANPSAPRYATATNLTSWKWFGWRTAGLAAACLALAVFGFRRVLRPVPPDATLAAHPPSSARPATQSMQPEPLPADRYQPVAASNVLYELKDEGLVREGGEAPARRVRYRYVDTYTWRNPRGNASLKWSVPRDEIRVIPASLH